jgi:cold-inducible RNA-binding protein
MAKLFVGSLSYAVDQDGLKEIFEKFGTVVEAHVIKDRETGRSRGFGFVTMSSDVEAQAAISGLNGSSVNGRTIVVNPANDSNRSRTR